MKHRHQTLFLGCILIASIHASAITDRTPQDDQEQVQRDSFAWMSTSPAAADAFTAELCDLIQNTRDQLATVCGRSPSADNPEAPLTERLTEAFILGEAETIDEAVVRPIGPIISHSVEGWPEPWWQLVVSCTNPDKEDNADETAPKRRSERNTKSHAPDALERAEDTTPPNLRLLSGLDKAKISNHSEILAQRHQKIIDAMQIISTVDPLAPSEHNDDPPPLFTDLPEPPGPISSGSSVLDIVVWFEQMDARQAWLRRWTMTREADLATQDMLAMARALQCPYLETHVRERIPTGATDFHSLIWHKSWPTDAWEILSACEALWKRVAHTQEKFDQMLKRIQRELKLDPRILEHLKLRLIAVINNLPPGFEWSRTFQKEVETRLLERLTPSDAGGSYWGPATLESADDLVSGCMTAQTSAWKIHARTWSEPDALLPSEVAERTQQHAEIMQTVQSWQDDPQVQEVFAIPDEDDRYHPSFEHLLSQVKARLEDPWRPWMVFPMQASRSPTTMIDFQNELTGWLERSEDREGLYWALNSLPGDLDDVMNNGYYTPGCRYALYPDCMIHSEGSSVMVNGELVNYDYIGLYSNRQYPDEQ